MNRLSRVDYLLAALAVLFIAVTACALTQGPPTGTPRGTAGSPPRGLPPPAAPPAVGRLRAVAPGATAPAGSLAAVATADPNNGQLGRTFAESFDGVPAAPAPFSGVTPNGIWDVTVHSRDVNTWTRLTPMTISHGPDCAGPPATHHTDGAYEDAVFSCRDHLMTALYAQGYGLIYLTPNQRVDFSSGTATITFDVSTLRTSERDWIDLWVTPFGENMQLALDRWLPDLSGEPQDAIHIKMNTYDAPDGTAQSVFGAEVVRGGVVESVPGNWWQGYESFLTTSASRRDTFQLRISPGHLQFGMPAGQAAVNSGQAFWWVDADLATPLSWTSGVVQLGQHSYNPSKNSPVDANGVPIYGPDTWHWDNVRIAPAVPFFMSLGTPRLVSHNWPQPPGPQGPITFAQAAPDNAFLRFTATGDNVRISLDGGATWQPATEQPGTVARGGDMARSFWMPVPRGTSVVLVNADGGWWGDAWAMSDFSLWALSSPDAVPTPLATATFVPTPDVPTPTPAATATITATFPPTPTPGPTQPTSTPTPVPTVTRTPTPAATMTSTATVMVTASSTPLPTATPTATATGTATSTSVPVRSATAAPATPTLPVQTATPAPPTPIPAYESTQSARIAALETCVAGLTNARLRC